MLRALLPLLLAMMPVAIMTGPDLPSTIYYLALAASLGLLIQHRFAGAGDVTRQYRWLIAAVGAPLAVVLLAAPFHGFVASADLETGLRFFLGVWLVVLALSYVPNKIIWHVTWGFLLATVAAAAFIFYLSWPDFRRPETGAVYNAVGYGNLTALITVLVAFSLRWTVTPWVHAERALKVIIAALGLAAFIITQTRSGWVAVPAFAIIAGVLFTTRRRPARVVIACIAALAVMATVFLSSDTLRSRAVVGYEQFISCRGEQSTADTSICIRLQLWRASLDMMSQNPLIGMGSKRFFGDKLQSDSLPKGLVSEYVADGWGEPHNDIMLALASFGIPGGIALLLVYLAPAWIFARRLSFQNSAAVRTAAAMGLAVCLGFLIFGIAETMLRGMRTASFYAMCVAVFLALSDPARDTDTHGEPGGVKP